MKKFIFILSVGRSGSTALQNLLNSHNRVLIRGENNNFFYNCFTVDAELGQKNNQKLIEPDSSANPWFGYKNFKQKRYRKAIKKVGLAFLTGDLDSRTIKTVGFKEIRLYGVFDSILKTQSRLDGKKELLKYMDFMNHIFPNNKTIFIARDPSEIVKSGWWAKSKNTDRLKRNLTIFQETCFLILETLYQIMNILYFKIISK